MSMDRTGFIGSSDAAAILGISPWKTPLQLYLEKIGEAPKQEVEANLKAKTRGKRLEPYIIDMLRTEHSIVDCGRNLITFDRRHQFLRSETDLYYRMDNEFGRVRRAELKTVHPFKLNEWGEEDTDSVPVWYTAQAMHGMMIDDQEETLFAVLIGDDLRLFKVPRDEQIIVSLREKEIEFWEKHVLARVPPPATTVKDVLTMFSKDLGTIAEADDETYAAIQRMREIEPMRKEYDRLKEKASVFMGSAATLTREGEILATWKTQSRSDFMEKKFKEEHPALAQLFTKHGISRVFRLK